MLLDNFNYLFFSEKRKIHKLPVPIIGGLLIFVNILVFVLFGFLKNINLLYNVFISTELKGLVYFLTFVTFIFFTGLYDDKYKIRPLTRLILLTLFIYFLIISDNNLLIKSFEFSFSALKINFDLGKVFLVLASLITLIIACNMSDGINLQSSSFFLINFLTLYYFKSNDFILFIVIILIIFSYLNFKGKIFLGDSGSYVLSLLLGFYFIKYYNFNYILYADHVFLFLFFPVLDALRCFIFRLMKGRSIFLPDNMHFHHILLNKIGYTKTIIVLSCFYLFPIIGFLLKLNSIYSLIIILVVYFVFLYRFKF